MYMFSRYNYMYIITSWSIKIGVKYMFSISETLDFSFTDFHTMIHIMKFHRSDRHFIMNYYYITLLSFIHSAIVNKKDLWFSPTRRGKRQTLGFITRDQATRKLLQSPECLLEKVVTTEKWLTEKCCGRSTGTLQEHRRRGTSAVGSRYHRAAEALAE
jgi:hypothetical protein